MSRPKRSETSVTAYDRISNAFWEMLSEMPYSKITIRELSKRASVNHNLIYYYFENMDDMASKLLLSLFSDGLPQKILSKMLSANKDETNTLIDHEMITRIMKLRLFFRSDSPLLARMVKKQLIHEWVTYVHLTEEQLTMEEKIDLDFIFSGLVSVIESDAYAADPQIIASLLNRPIGKGIFGTLSNLSKKN